MPNSLSAKKRLRQNEKLRQANRAIRTGLRSQIRKVREAVAGGQLETADAEGRVASRKIDKACARGVLHKNTAARTKSRIQHLIKKAKAEAAA
ncbi:30S ribosomal protein S20 [Roseimaritima multifibrata]|uniref:Small ribosomal subunit protein bS20 n=1 Tax=Roseimaritima multifibrata TaxID=1930274 RepID=A0A517MNG6_9BACT|nr:30S ribosomal protein S20 [Roseimaritima multifibrata]QDS96421.1 30S ribosomal protein S20 [Roseimaritima multifibrata]